MQGIGSEKPTSPPPPGISADFLTGSTDVGLDRIRTRLLDLTNRNKLLNFRHSKTSSLRFVDVPLNAVFRRLRDNDKFAFRPVPPPFHRAADAPNAKDHAELLGWDTSFDLEEGNEGRDEEIEALPVLHFAESLDAVSRKIASAAKTAIEESGANMLHMVFGFLEWYESEDSEQPRSAPLVILPVSIERTGEKGKAIQAVIEYSGEDLETNLSLAEKMRRDFGLEVPTMEDDDTPEDYFERFAEILELKKRWSIRRQITLALLSFGKLLMYRDLDPKTWPADASIAKHPLVREFFEGSKNEHIEHAEEYPIDEPELKKDVPHLIRDADSSQHSALVHALRGQNLVLEGPPGTGKSQTITNLIAAALARGKTVLFVSEKLAALEVVRRRLDDAGLGVFCLEVHSHKTKKGALLNDLARRYQMRGTFKDPRELDRHLAIVDEKKTLLTRYAALVNKMITPFNATVFEILWGRDRCGQDVAVHQDRLVSVILPVVVQYSRADFAQAEQSLSVYGKHLAAALAACGSLDQHPWAWIGKPLGFRDEELVLGLLDEFLATVHEAEHCSELLENNAGIDVAQNAEGLTQAASALDGLPEPGGPLLRDLLASCQDLNARQLVQEFTMHVDSFRLCLQSLSGVATDASRLLDDGTVKTLVDASGLLNRLGLESHSAADLKVILRKTLDASQLLEDAQSSFRVLMDVMGCDVPSKFSSAKFLLETARIIDSTPVDLLHLRQPQFESEHARPALYAAAQQAAALRAAERVLKEEFGLSLIGGSISLTQLVDYAGILSDASLWSRIFGREYRAATKAYQSLSLVGRRAGRIEKSRALRSAAGYLQQCDQFDNHADYRAMFGSCFHGVGSPWDELTIVLNWYQEVLVGLPQHQSDAEPFRRMLTTARVESLKAIKGQLGLVAADRARLEEAVGRIAEIVQMVPSERSKANSVTFEQLMASLSRLADDLTQVIRTVEEATISDDVPLRALAGVFKDSACCRNAIVSVQGVSELAELIGPSFRGINTNVEPIKNTLRVAESIVLGPLPRKAVEWLLSADHEARIGRLRTWLAAGKELGLTLLRLAHDLASVSGSTVWDGIINSSWGSARAAAQHAMSNRDELARWNHFLRVKIRSKDDGLDRLTTLAESRTIKPDELGSAFHFVFYNTVARSIFATYGELSHATGITQEQVGDQFRAADKAAIRLYSDRVAALVDRQEIPSGNHSGPVSTWTEMALITKEINKQKRHIPIRQLIQRSAKAMVALKPCFMMSPLSVAQYLAPGQLKFDLVVMDEASQLKPEDAIGAIARAGQIVIVGDPKQLPPTNFFQRVASDDEEEASEELRTAVEEGESILDVASTLFQPVRRLRWHYRSRHHSLIAFSNNEFYQGDLIIFPSAFHDDPTLGVKHNFVAEGVFDNGRNAPEAAAVVEAVLEHMRRCPNESLGVVTLNFEQRELVEELLDQRLRDDPAAISFQDRMKGGQEQFFVKNLENVQGDERDVIFISTTYGPDTRGNQFQRFGPINSGSGHRRLNVLFTRAKKRTVVFSSLDPDRIQTTASSAWGLRALKQYLIFARSGVLHRPEESADQATNDFERSVGGVLKEHGFEVVPQVGVAGFFIDLAVRHPVKEGTFLLGIECDGASYHSSRSARDRDRLRQEILENLGWKIHRVWSTDWFKSRDTEVRRLVGKIKRLLAEETRDLTEVVEPTVRLGSDMPSQFVSNLSEPATNVATRLACPKCGSSMMPRQGRFGEILACGKCGHFGRGPQ